MRLNLPPADHVLTGYRLLTMCRPGTVLARDESGEAVFVQPEGDWMSTPLEGMALGICDGQIAWIVPETGLSTTPPRPRLVKSEPEALAENADSTLDSHPKESACASGSQEFAGLSAHPRPVFGERGPGVSASRRTGSERSIRLIGQGQLLTPGLIDCHTHLIFAGNRADEWAARLGGKTYAEIAQAGGGILSTVRKTRSASEDDLIASAASRLVHLLREGVTTVEIKSGYGLDLATELRMLRAARRLGELFPVRVVTTLLAAHVVPPEFAGRGDDYVSWVCREMIPAATGLCSAVDVFCESIAFSLAQTERIFDAAQSTGLAIKVHAEQLSRTGAAVMAAQRGALSVDHLEHLSEADCQLLATTSTVATLLPGAFYSLREKQLPPVVALLRAGVPIAVATDCNPGSSPLTSLLLAANMACNLFGLTAGQAFAGITGHAAQALGLERECGSLAPGKRADLCIWQANTVPELLYGLGQHPPVDVMFAGEPRPALREDRA